MLFLQFLAVMMVMVFSAFVMFLMVMNVFLCLRALNFLYLMICTLSLDRQPSILLWILSFFYLFLITSGWMNSLCFVFCWLFHLGKMVKQLYIFKIDRSLIFFNKDRLLFWFENGHQFLNLINGSLFCLILIDIGQIFQYALDIMHLTINHYLDLLFHAIAITPKFSTKYLI